MPDRATSIARDACELTGETPLVYLNNVTKGLPAKIEGKIKPGDVLIEGTSGNMGIALAFAAAVKGYRLILAMPSSMSTERRTLLKVYGAELVLTDPALGFAGVKERCLGLLKVIPNSVFLNQFDNPANPGKHYETTGPEIWQQTQGKVDIVVFGVGSAGTITGVGRYLKEKKPSVEAYAVEPFESSVISGFPKGKHGIQGIGAGMVPPNLDLEVLTETLRVKTEDAMAMTRRLPKEEGLLVGISSGANVIAAIELAKRPENAGKLIVTTLNSFGERYLSTELYNEVRVDAENMKESTLEQDLEHLAKNFQLDLTKREA